MGAPRTRSDTVEQRGGMTRRNDDRRPRRYAGIADEPWDVIVIEGWFEAVNAFIHEVCLRGRVRERQLRLPDFSCANVAIRACHTMS